MRLLHELTDGDIAIGRQLSPRGSRDEARPEPAASQGSGVAAVWQEPVSPKAGSL